MKKIKKLIAMLLAVLLMMAVLIPSALNGVTIDTIGQNAAMRMAVGRVWTIPSTVTTIKEGAFADNTRCYYFIIPARVTSIEAGFDGGGNYDATFAFPESLRNDPVVKAYYETTPDRVIFYPTSL